MRTRSMPLAALVTSALAACAAAPPPAPSRPPLPARRPAPERPEYTCHGPPERPLEPPAFVTSADGPTRLLVTAAGARARGAPLQSARVRVVALQAALGALGVELARALGVNVWVEPAVAQARLTFVGEFSVEELARMLGAAQLRLDVDDALIRLRAWSLRGEYGRAVGGTPAAPDLEPGEVRLFRLSERVNAATVARVFCRHLASHNGWASVAHRDLVASDRGARLAQLEALIRELDRADAARP